MSNADRLVELAKGRFGSLNAVEEEFFRKVGEGLPFDRSSGDAAADDPAKSDEWGGGRKLRSELLEWVCTDGEASGLVSHKGLTIIGVRFETQVDLSYEQIGFPLFLKKCDFRKKINLKMASLRAIDLGGSHTKNINGDNITVEGDVLLNEGFCAEGEVQFVGAKVGGDLICIKGKFVNINGYALICDGIEVKGCVFLRDGFKAEGEVRFLGASVGSSFTCRKGKFSNSEGKALICDGIDVKGGVFLRDDFKAEGEVRFFGAMIGGNLECDNSEFSNPKGHALVCDGIEVKGNVLLKDNFKAEGEVRFLGATVDNFNCDNGEFNNHEGHALNCDSMAIKGSVFLRDGFKAEGDVWFLGATVGVNFDCVNGKFNNPKKTALQCDGIEVKGNVLMRNGFSVEGGVDLKGATVAGAFVWTDVESPEKAALDLRSARVGMLWDDEGSWPEKGKLFLHGFVYDEIYEKALKDAGKRLKWLGLQGEYSPGPYEQLAKVLREDGHEDAAKTVQVAKNEEKAKQDDLTRAERLWYRVLGPMIGYGYRPWWAFYKGLFVNYKGRYKADRLVVRFLFSILFWILAGCVVFGLGFYHKSEIMVPSSVRAYEANVAKVADADKCNGDVREGYPTFQFITYSVDAFVPVVDLHQNKYWIPNANKGADIFTIGRYTIRWGGLLLFYLWLHIAAGWVLSTLFVVGLTGMVRK